jgi:hypothetical protein
VAAAVAAREVVALVAQVVERQEVLVALVEQQARLAEQQQARPKRVRRQAAA